MRVQLVNSVAKQYDQPRETGERRECSLAGLCGLQRFSKGVANGIKGTIHRVARRIPSQIKITSPTRQGEGGVVWVASVGGMLVGCKGQNDARSEQRIKIGKSGGEVMQSG